MYYVIMSDSTPDISRQYQTSHIYRYVHIDAEGVEVRESFVDFLPMKDRKDAVSTANMIVNKLTTDGLESENCRSQGYDNAATMSGIHTGVQTRLKGLNPKAIFVPCNNHSLNLAGLHAAACTTNAVTFFGTLEKLYAFLSKSTHRWEMLEKHAQITVKRICETRWSARFQAVAPVRCEFASYIEALEELRDTP